jgi:hypothetical protein
MKDTNPFTPPSAEARTSVTIYDDDLVPNANTPTLLQRIGKPAIVTTAMVAILGCLSLCTIPDSIFGVAFIFPFALGPLAITGLFGFVLASRIPQWILACSSICYGVWFMFMYTASVSSSSSTAAVGFLVIGLYSLPVLFVFWIAAWAAQLKSTSDHGI